MYSKHPAGKTNQLPLGVIDALRNPHQAMNGQKALTRCREVAQRGRMRLQTCLADFSEVQTSA
jgi:hypothetical protein